MRKFHKNGDPRLPDPCKEEVLSHDVPVADTWRCGGQAIRKYSHLCEYPGCENEMYS
mgnify:CR=1 FL=1